MYFTKHARAHLHKFVSQRCSVAAGSFCSTAYGALCGTQGKHGHSSGARGVLSSLAAFSSLGKHAANSGARKHPRVGGLPPALSDAPENLDAAARIFDVRCEFEIGPAAS